MLVAADTYLALVAESTASAANCRATTPTTGDQDVDGGAAHGAATKGVADSATPSTRRPSASPSVETHAVLSQNRRPEAKAEAGTAEKEGESGSGVDRRTTEGGAEGGKGGRGDGLAVLVQRVRLMVVGVLVCLPLRIISHMPVPP